MGGIYGHMQHRRSRLGMGECRKGWVAARRREFIGLAGMPLTLACWVEGVRCALKRDTTYIEAFALSAVGVCCGPSSTQTSELDLHTVQNSQAASIYRSLLSHIRELMQDGFSQRLKRNEKQSRNHCVVSGTFGGIFCSIESIPAARCRHDSRKFI